MTSQSFVIGWKQTKIIFFLTAFRQLFQSGETNTLFGQNIVCMRRCLVVR